MKESEIQKQILEYLRSQYGLKHVRKIHTVGIKGRTNSNKGFPDIVVLDKFRKQVIFFEIKKDKKSNLTEEQLDFKSICEECKIKHYVVCSIEEAQYAVERELK